jgi:hypothetical protein
LLTIGKWGSLEYTFTIAIKRVRVERLTEELTTEIDKRMNRRLAVDINHLVPSLNAKRKDFVEIDVEEDGGGDVDGREMIDPSNFLGVANLRG